MTESMHVLNGQIRGAFHASRAEVPTAGEGEVRVRVRAAGFNNVDRMLLADTYDNLPDGPTGNAPYIAGLEFSGVVESLGEGVEGLELGDRVMGFGHGAFAEYIVVAPNQLIPLPQEIGFADAAALRVALSIAHDALTERVDLTPVHRCSSPAVLRGSARS